MTSSYLAVEGALAKRTPLASSAHPTNIGIPSSAYLAIVARLALSLTRDTLMRRIKTKFEKFRGDKCLLVLCFKAMWR
jgi:hypothetical protein